MVTHAVERALEVRVEVVGAFFVHRGVFFGRLFRGGERRDVVPVVQVHRRVREEQEERVDAHKELQPASTAFDTKARPSRLSRLDRRGRAGPSPRPEVTLAFDTKARLSRPDRRGRAPRLDPRLQASRLDPLEAQLDSTRLESRLQASSLDPGSRGPPLSTSSLAGDEPARDRGVAAASRTIQPHLAGALRSRRGRSTSFESTAARPSPLVDRNTRSAS